MDIAEMFPEMAPIDENTLPDAAPEVPEAPEPQLTAEPPTSTEAPPKEPAHVPLGALQEERQRRQELKAELEQERQHRQKMEERFQKMMEQFQPQQQAPQEEAIVPFEEDPARHVQQLTARYERQLEQLRQGQEQQQSYVQQQQQMHNLVNTARAAEDAFRAQAQDYSDVTNAFTQQEIARYKAFGFNEQQARDQVSRDFLALTQYATQNGRNPAEMLYNAAKQLQAPVAPAQAQNAPQAPARAPNGQFVPKQAPTTLATTPGAPKAPDESGDLTLEKIASMDDQSFDKFWKQLERGSITMPKV